MKHLLIIRHGHAAHGHSMDDFDRPLTGRGKKECRKMAELAGEWIARGEVPPLNIFLSSPAVRTRQTAEIFSAALLNGNDGEVQYDGLLYLPTMEECLEVLWSTPEEVQTLAFCSHNPG